MGIMIYFVKSIMFLLAIKRCKAMKEASPTADRRLWLSFCEGIANRAQVVDDKEVEALSTKLEQMNPPTNDMIGKGKNPNLKLQAWCNRFREIAVGCCSRWSEAFEKDTSLIRVENVSEQRNPEAWNEAGKQLAEKLISLKSVPDDIA